MITKTFEKTVATGTATALETTGTQVRKIIIYADPANTVPVFIGNLNVTAANGFPIPIGGALTLDNEDRGFGRYDTAEIFAIATIAAQKLRIILLGKGAPV